MSTLDQTRRREGAAFALIRIIQRDEPKIFERLRNAVCDGLKEIASGMHLPDEKYTIVAEWCASLDLDCDAVQSAAMLLSLFPDDKPLEAGDAKFFVWQDERGEIRDHSIDWRAGETKKTFLGRAEELFDRMKRLEENSGTVAAVNPINPKHIEWLVRFQAWKEPLTKIAAVERTDRHDVKRAIRGIATLLELKLRPTTSGRPRGRGGAKRPAHHVVRRERRR